jgi:hypothetical protein
MQESRRLVGVKHPIVVGWRRLLCLANRHELGGEATLNCRRAKQQREKRRLRQSRRASRIARDVIQTGDRPDTVAVQICCGVCHVGFNFEDQGDRGKDHDRFAGKGTGVRTRPSSLFCLIPDFRRVSRE